MAIIVLSDIITDIRGTVGTHTYSYWNGIHLVKNRSVNYHTAHKSEAVAPYNSFIARLSQHWAMGLTPLQRDGWESYAVHIATIGFPWYGSDVIKLVGLRQYGGIMSGFNAFVLTNQLRRSIGLTTILEDDPEAVSPPNKPNFASLEALVGPPKKLKVTTLPAGTYAEDTYLRIFCRGTRFAHLIIARVADNPSPQEETWDVNYAADHLPPDATPAWTLEGADMGGVALGILTVTIPPLTGTRGYYRQPAWGTKWTAEIKLRYDYTDDPYQFKLHVPKDGTNTYWPYIRIFPDKVNLLWGAGLYEDFPMVTTDSYHTYRLVGDGSEVQLWIDGVHIATKTMTTFVAPGSKYIWVRCDGNVNAFQTKIDWVKYNLTQKLVPSPLTFEWENMRYADGAVLPLVNDVYNVQLDQIGISGRYSPPSDILSAQIRDMFPGGLWGSHFWNGYVWG